MRSAGLPVILTGSPINHADHLIGSPISWHHTGRRPSFDEVALQLASIEEDFRQRSRLDALQAAAAQRTGGLPRSQTH